MPAKVTTITVLLHIYASPRMDDSPHAFKKLQMVFLSLHAFEVVSNILEKVCSKALKHSLQFSVVVKLNFSQPRDVVLIKSTQI